MKILPKLKEKLVNAKTPEEKKQVFLDAGIELDDKELDQIIGGMGDNSPLVVIDGVPFTYVNDIPASNIESMDVLKDASSTAIYGSRH